MEQHRGLVLEPRLWGRAGQLGEAKAQKDVAHSSTADKEGLWPEPTVREATWEVMGLGGAEGGSSQRLWSPARTLALLAGSWHHVLLAWGKRS